MQSRLRYQQLQLEDRVTIASMCQRGCSVLPRPLPTSSNATCSPACPMARISPSRRASVARQFAGEARAKLDVDGVILRVVLTLLTGSGRPNILPLPLSAPFPTSLHATCLTERSAPPFMPCPGGGTAPPAHCLSASGRRHPSTANARR